MAKFKPKPIVKWDSFGDKYTFIGGKARVPGFRLSGKPVLITLKEFKESNAQVATMKTS